MSTRDRQRWEGKHREARPSSTRQAADFVRAQAPLLHPGLTLDLASGSGRNAVFLAGLGHRVIAVDVAREALAALRRVSPTPSLVQMDLDAAGFRPGSFDTVVCVNFLDRRLFEEIPRWLRPGGILVVDTFLVDQATIGHPSNPAFLLEHNELLERLRGRLRILRYCEGLTEADGEPAFRASCVATRER